MPRDTGLFANAQLPERRFFREFGPGFAVSFTLQTGVCAVLLHHPALAGFAFAAGAALATVFALASARRPARQAAARACRALFWDSR